MRKYTSQVAKNITRHNVRGAPLTRTKQEVSRHPQKYVRESPRSAAATSEKEWGKKIRVAVVYALNIKV